MVRMEKNDPKIFFESLFFIRPFLFLLAFLLSAYPPSGVHPLAFPPPAFPPQGAQGVRSRECDKCLEQIAFDFQREGSFLQADKRLCDIQPQAASLCVTGAVSAHNRSINSSAGILSASLLIFFMERITVSFSFLISIYTLVYGCEYLQALLRRLLSTRHVRLPSTMANRGVSPPLMTGLQMGVFQLFLIFCNCLCRQLAHIRRGKLYLEVACRSLGGLNQVLGQLFQPAGCLSRTSIYSAACPSRFSFFSRST